MLACCVASVYNSSAAAAASAGKQTQTDELNVNWFQLLLVLLECLNDFIAGIKRFSGRRDCTSGSRRR